jgi:hypothetical protein
MTCPRCRLNLVAGTEHRTAEDCLRHLVPRHQATVRKLALTIKQIDTQRNRTQKSLRLTAPGLQRRLKAVEAALGRAEEARQRYDYLVAEMVRLGGRVAVLEGISVGRIAA